MPDRTTAGGVPNQDFLHVAHRRVRIAFAHRAGIREREFVHESGRCAEAIVPAERTHSAKAYIEKGLSRHVGLAKAPIPHGGTKRQLPVSGSGGGSGQLRLYRGGRMGAVRLLCTGAADLSLPRAAGVRNARPNGRNRSAPSGTGLRIRSECELVSHASPHPWSKQSRVRDNPPCADSSAGGSTQLRGAATALSLRIEQLRADRHHQVCELLQRLAPYGQRVSIWVHERLRHLLPVESSTFHLVLEESTG